MKPQPYFAHLEFEPFDIRSLEVVEMTAEKVRAAFQRAKVRDLYDLHRFATTPFDGELVRRLAVLKLWQVRDPFDPDAFFERIRGSQYEWEDLHRLVRSVERQLVRDARGGRNEPLAERLRAEIRALFATWTSLSG